jgi:hypothetical protein
MVLVAMTRAAGLEQVDQGDTVVVEGMYGGDVPTQPTPPLFVAVLQSESVVRGGDIVINPQTPLRLARESLEKSPESHRFQAHVHTSHTATLVKS